MRLSEETPSKPVQILKHTTQNSAEQTSMRTKWFKHIAILNRSRASPNFSVRKKGCFSEKGRGNSVSGGFGEDFYRNGNSVKSFGPFTEPPDSEN